MSRDFIPGLWIGGGIRRDVAEHVEALLLTDSVSAAVVQDPQLRAGLMNLANAIRAELQRLPAPACDLI